jgi:hypothetical protein
VGVVADVHPGEGPAVVAAGGEVVGCTHRQWHRPPQFVIQKLQRTYYHHEIKDW